MTVEEASSRLALDVDSLVKGISALLSPTRSTLDRDVEGVRVMILQSADLVHDAAVEWQDLMGGIDFEGRWWQLYRVAALAPILIKGSLDNESALSDVLDLFRSALDGVDSQEADELTHP